MTARVEQTKLIRAGSSKFETLLNLVLYEELRNKEIVAIHYAVVPNGLGEGSELYTALIEYMDHLEYYN